MLEAAALRLELHLSPPHGLTTTSHLLPAILEPLLQVSPPHLQTLDLSERIGVHAALVGAYSCSGCASGESVRVQLLAEPSLTVDLTQWIAYACSS